MGFSGGGGGGASGVSTHWHSNETDNGGPLKMRASSTDGTTFTLVDAGDQNILEALLA